jgi:RNA-directed DNA polymerase
MTVGMPTGALSPQPVAWHTIDWYAVHRTVRRLQARMVQAVQAGRWGKVHALQHLLTHSFSGKALAVKRVTSNDGHKTPGVDGILWDTPEKQADATHELRQRGYRPRPLRRISIPKHDGTARHRPLSIPTMHDRAMQALYLLALDPIAETRGDPHASGFRMERSTADAMEQGFNALATEAFPPVDFGGRPPGLFRRDQPYVVIRPYPDGASNTLQVAAGWVRGPAGSLPH